MCFTAPKSLPHVRGFVYLDVEFLDESNITLMTFVFAFFGAVILCVLINSRTESYDNNARCTTKGEIRVCRNTTL